MLKRLILIYKTATMAAILIIFKSHLLPIGKSNELKFDGRHWGVMEMRSAKTIQLICLR